MIQLIKKRNLRPCTVYPEPKHGFGALKGRYVQEIAQWRPVLCVAVHGFKGSGFTGSKFNINFNRLYVSPELWLRLWFEKTNSWHSRLIHTQNGGIIQLRVPPRLIYSIRLYQKGNLEPLNPEPVNAYVCVCFGADYGKSSRKYRQNWHIRLADRGFETVCFLDKRLSVGSI